MKKKFVIMAILFAPFLLPFVATSIEEKQVARLAWFTKIPNEGTQEQLAKYFDFFIFTKSDEEYREELKAKGVRSTFLQYLLFPAIQNPKSHGGRPYRNQVADRAADFAGLRAKNADWFLYDERGKLLEDDSGYVMMDPANSGWRKFWLERAKESQENLGWDGVFLDNVEASLVKREQRGQMPAKYRDEGSYLAAIESFLHYISQNYFRPSRRLLYANIISIKDRSVWFRYLKHLDGAMYEGFALDWRGYRQPEEWNEHLEWAEETQKTGKEMILVSQGEKNDLPRQQFAYASYLLIANGKASFRYAHQNHYREVWVYNNYDLELGTPKGARYRKEDGTWCRDFMKGRVCANPQNHKSEITTR
jgi:hypothetical protein